MSNISPTVPALITSMWNGTAAPSAVPSIAPSAPLPSPVNTTYYAPSVSQVILYVVITTIIIVGISLLNRRTTHTTADASGDAAAANGTNTSQDQVDLVKSMTPDERKEYVTNFLRTQKFVDINDNTNESSVSFRVTTSSSFRLDNSMNDTESTDAESNFPINTVSSADKGYPGCAICLDRFKNGEDICCAQNQECPHEFHLECLFPWLLKSQDCPCCRRDYLTIMTMPTDETTDAAESTPR